ncbi:MAG: DUF2284 domain-containing protein [Firmicutes bacterium]|nr:DUF2284 domain-containing protein [Bacillota bacterium]
MNKHKEYIALANKMGAKNAVPFSIEQIAFDPRTILKCRWGCDDFGKLHTCPSAPHSLSVEEYIRIFKHYKSGVIINCHDKKDCQKISMEIERHAYLDGFYFAISLSDCAICTECKGKFGKPCVAPKLARPAFHSIGVDVFKTAKNMGLPLHPLKEKTDEQNWYSAVFIE